MEMDIVPCPNFFFPTRRVGPGRRLYGMFHHSLPWEPLVSIQVALTENIADNVDGILTEPNSVPPDLDSVRCGMFYSITTQTGLSGVELGGFLIKRVVRELQNEFPNIKTFCTISPIPGFRKWLKDRLQTASSKNQSILSYSEKQLINKIFEPRGDYDTKAGPPTSERLFYVCLFLLSGNNNSHAY